MSGKSLALELIKLAAAIFPPLVSLLESVLDRAPPEHASLADEIRTILPERSKTREALDELDAAGKDRPR